MLTKFGINNIKAEKSSPTVKSASFKKIVICNNCGCKCEKICPSEHVCDASVLKCPKCGNNIK